MDVHDTLEVSQFLAVETLAIALFESDMRATASVGCPGNLIRYEHQGWINAPRDVKAYYRGQATTSAHDCRNHFGRQQ